MVRHANVPQLVFLLELLEGLLVSNVSNPGRGVGDGIYWFGQVCGQRGSSESKGEELTETTSE